MSASHVTTHVLDTAIGRPASGVSVALDARDGTGWTEIASGSTDADGRVHELGPARLESGVHRLRFDTAAYFAAIDTASFFPEVVLTFLVDAEQEHYHVPLLLSPFAYSTYRGS